MHLQYVEPAMRYADIIIPEGGFNNAAIDLIRRQDPIGFGIKTFPISRFSFRSFELITGNGKPVNSSCLALSIPTLPPRRGTNHGSVFPVLFVLLSEIPQQPSFFRCP